MPICCTGLIGSPQIEQFINWTLYAKAILPNPVTTGDKLFAIRWQKLQTQVFHAIARSSSIHAVLRAIGEARRMAAHTGFEPVYRP